MKRIILRVLLGFGVVVFLAVGLFFYYAYITDGCDCGLAERTPFIVWNPLRDHAPQRMAEQYLKALVEEKCSSLSEELFTSPQAHAEVCNVRHPLHKWELRSIETGKDWAGYDYGVGWDNQDEMSAPLGISLVRADGKWKIQQISTFY